MTFHPSVLTEMTSSPFTASQNGHVIVPQRVMDRPTSKSTPTEQALIPLPMTHRPIAQGMNSNVGPVATQSSAYETT